VYGILISLGILSAILLAEYLVKRDKKDAEIIWNLSLVLIISGIIGARLYHVIDYWKYYTQSPIKILYIWEGGLGIHGAIILGLIATIIYLKQIKLATKDIIYYISICVSVLPLGQAIGRWGNFFNKEIYGIETTLPWGININGVTHHPLFLYESLALIILFSTLMYLKLHKRVSPKTIISVYFAGYGIIRFLLEYLRYEKDIWIINGINISQLISIFFILFSYILITKDKLPK